MSSKKPKTWRMPEWMEAYMTIADCTSVQEVEDLVNNQQAPGLDLKLYARTIRVRGACQMLIELKNRDLLKPNPVPRKKDRVWVNLLRD